MEKQEKDNNSEKIQHLAAQVMKLSRDDILIHLRFLDAALARLSLQEKPALHGLASDGQFLYYDPVTVLQIYRDNPKLLTRAYLHSLLHCIFAHSFGSSKLENDDWDLATDIAVEAIILELDLTGTRLENDGELQGILRVLKEDAGAVTAEKLYRLFQRDALSTQRRYEYHRLFSRDVHAYWRPAEELEMTQEQWQQISRRIRTDLKAFSKAKGAGEALSQNLEETLREKYDYSGILRRFLVMGEHLSVNEDEFDYIYYTYGLQLYGNLPLVEPLEYKEDKKVREFVIALDTSASCRGNLVKAFLKKTVGMLRSENQFFQKVNIHIIQCDSEVQNDFVIRSIEDLDVFLAHEKLVGFGATDFRPVFDYVDDLIHKGEFENLKGLIYFTDGYGIYPERMPGYEVIFAFLNEDQSRAPVPPWAIKVVLQEEELEEQLEEQLGEQLEEQPGEQESFDVNQ